MRTEERRSGVVVESDLRNLEPPFCPPAGDLSIFRLLTKWSFVKWEAAAVARRPPPRIPGRSPRILEGGGWREGGREDEQMRPLKN